MNSKIKTENLSNKFNNLSYGLGVVMLSLASTYGMLDLPQHARAQILSTSRPAFAYANSNDNSGKNNPIQKTREETEQNYVSYSVSQRTPGRSSKH
jgi:hypothetical protein